MRSLSLVIVSNAELPSVSGRAVDESTSRLKMKVVVRSQVMHCCGGGVHRPLPRHSLYQPPGTMYLRSVDCGASFVGKNDQSPP